MGANSALDLNISGNRGTDNATTTGFRIKNVESLNVTNFATSTNAGENILALTGQPVGLANVNVVGSSSTGNTSVTGIASIVNAGMSSGTGGLKLTYEDAAVVGTADVQSLTLNGQTGGTFVANGIETLNIVGTGAESKGVTVDLANNTNFKTVNIDSVSKLGVAFSDDTITAIDGSNSTGALTINAATPIGNTKTTVTGGSGDDVINIGTSFNKDDVINGGEGSNTVVITGGATTIGSAAGVTNFETLRVEKAQAGTGNTTETVNLDVFSATALKTVQAAVTQTSTTSNTSTLAINNWQSDLSLNVRAASANAGLTTGTQVNVSLKQDTTADTLNASIGGQSMKGIQATQVETVKLASNANSTGTVTANSIGALSVAAAKTVTVTGAADLTTTVTMNATSTAGQSRTYDGSQATGKQTITFASAGNQNITTGSGADKVTLVSGSLDSSDVIDLGAGTDTLVDGGVTGALGVLNVKNTELIEVTTAATTSFDLRENAALTNLKVTAGAAGHAVSVTSLADAAAVQVVAPASHTGALSFGYNSGSTTGSVTLENSSTGPAAAIAFSSLSVTGVPTLNLTSTGTEANTLTSLSSTSALTTLNLAGDKNLTLTGSTGTTGLATIDASGMTGNFTLGAGVVRAAAAAITAGAGDDNIGVNINTQAGNSLNGGTGTDTLSLSGTGNIALSVIDLSSLTNQITSINGQAYSGTTLGFENLNASGMAAGFGVNVTASTLTTAIVGSINADVITGASSGTMRITGDKGADVITLGGATEDVAFTLASLGTGVDTIVGFASTVDDLAVGGSNFALGANLSGTDFVAYSGTAAAAAATVVKSSGSAALTDSSAAALFVTGSAAGGKMGLTANTSVLLFRGDDSGTDYAGQIFKVTAGASGGDAATAVLFAELDGINAAGLVFGDFING